MEKIDLSNEFIEQAIKLNPNKIFDAIYAIREDGSVVKLNCKVTGNEVVFTNKGLGKYIVSYKSADSNKEKDNHHLKQEDSKEKKINYLLLAISSVSALLVGGTSYFIIRKKNNY